MNNYYTLKQLITEIHPEITGMRFIWACTPRQNVLEIGFQGENKSRRIIIDTGRPGQAFFVDQYQPPPAKNTVMFFKPLINNILRNISLAKRDRIISLDFGDNRKLMVVLYGSSANIFHVNNGSVEEAFLNSDDWVGERPPELFPAPAERPFKDSMAAKRKITLINPLLPRNMLDRLIQHHKLESATADEIISFTQSLSHTLAENPEPRLLSTGELCLIPGKILPVDEIKTFTSVNEAVRFTYYRHLKESKTKDSLSGILGKLEERKQSIEKQLAGNANPEQHLRRAEKYEKFGHLLMAHLTQEETRQKDSVTVNDLYEDHKQLTIKLHPGQSLVENANEYYEKASHARKTYRTSIHRYKILEKEYEGITALYNEVSGLSDNPAIIRWIKDNRDQLTRFGIADEKDNRENRPYRRLALEGYEVWIGKNARSNDILTASAHKEDLWLHVRDQPGSHVVIRMNNHKNFPDKHIILRVAAIAAYNSKARGASMVPVSYTKKKYVRKPKGAEPGTVVLDREEVVMVKPQKPR